MLPEWGDELPVVETGKDRGNVFSYQLYKVVHFLGIFCVLVSLGGMSLHAANGGLRQENVARRLVGMLHGLGAFLILLGGFGMFAKMTLPPDNPFPGWMWIKVIIWIALSLLPLLPYRKPELARPLLLLIPLLGLVAAYVGIYQPF